MALPGLKSHARSRLIGLATLTVAGVLLGVGGCPQLLEQLLPNTDVQQKEETFKTSLHGTRQGKTTWYSKENGGFETLTGVPMDQLDCLNCHAKTLADGTPVDPETYQPSCADCHVEPGDQVAQETCLGCHSRQGLEAKLFSDVHRDAGMVCTDCHSDREMHGDGNSYASLSAEGALDTKCENCHKSSGGTAPLPDNTAHSIHMANVDCSACHVQSVVSCANCHFESEIAGGGKRFPGPLTGFVLLLRKADTGKVVTGTLMSLTYQGKTFATLAPIYGHTVTAQARECPDCHNNANVQQYTETGTIPLVTYDESQNTLTGPQGVVPVPPDWKTALTFDFMDYGGDPASTETDPSQWSFLKSGADLLQMLFAEPLTDEQMQKLQTPMGG